MKRFVFTILLATLYTTALCAAPAASHAEPIRVLLLDGQSGGPYHDWQLTTRVLKRELEDTGLFRVSIATSPRFGEDFINFKPEFSRYQAIILNYDAPDWPADLRAQLHALVHVVRDSPAGQVIAELIGQAQTDPELKAAYLQSYSSPRRALAVEVMERAKDRGQLRSDLNPETVIDQLWGACYHRLLVPDQPITVEFVDALVDNLFRGIR